MTIPSDLPLPTSASGPVEPSTSIHGRRDQALAAGALVWAAALFGTSFVVVKDALDSGDLRAIPYLAFRFLIAAALFALLGARRPRRAGDLRIGVQAGLSYTAGMVCQTVGLQHTTAATAAFLTYLLVVAVPLITFFMTGKRPSRTVMVAIGVAVVGLALLTGGGVGFGIGELLSLCGAVAFAFHLIQVADAAATQDLLHFNAIQCAVVGLVLLPFVPFTGGIPSTPHSWAVVVYAAVFVTVLTFLPWTWASRHIDATRASLIFLTEPVFAAVAAGLTGESLTVLATIGAVLILASAALAELAPVLAARSRSGR